MTDDYSDYPKSVTEVLSDKADDGNLWTARDMLIFFLREIDSGRISPRLAVVGIIEPDPETEGGNLLTFNVAGRGTHIEYLGMFTRMQMRYGNR